MTSELFHLPFSLPFANSAEIPGIGEPKKADEPRAFKPKVAGSNPVGRIPRCSVLCRGLPGAEPSLRADAGSAFRGAPDDSRRFRGVCVTSWSHSGAGTRVFPMPQEKTDARKAVRAAQKQFERESDAAQKARRKAFAQAQKEGLSLREIGEEVGLHRSRIAQIIKGE